MFHTVLADNDCLLVQARYRLILSWHSYSKQSNSGHGCCFVKCSWIHRIKIVKMAILTEQFIDSMQFPSKFQHNSLQTLREILNFVWESNNLRIAKTILNRKRISGVSYHHL